MEKKQDEENDPSVTDRIRNFMMARHGLGGSDNREYDVAMNVDPSSSTANTQDLPHMAGGGLLDSFENLMNSPAGKIVGYATNPVSSIAGELEKSAPEMWKQAKPALEQVGSGLQQFGSSMFGLPASSASAETAPPAQNSPEEQFANKLSGADIAAGGPEALDAFNETIGKGPKAAHTDDSHALRARALKTSGLPGMPESVNPDALGKYIQGQRNALQQYGPEAQMQTQADLIKARTSPGMALASGGAGLADSIMQGVARAGNPGFQQKLESQGNQMAAEASGSFDKARQAQMQNVEAGQKLDAMDPHSPLSRAYQQAFAPIFQKPGMGYDLKAVMAMPASQIQTLADLGVRHGDTQMQLELKKVLLGMQDMTAKANIQNQQSERRQGALKELSGMPWYSRMMHPGISGQLEQEAGLNAPEGGHAPDVLSFAKTHGISPDQAAAIKAKRMGQ